ncbi:retrovirus-related pol polyprotein from transposon TNT 1-94 [Tanacetum coccineum]
MGITEGERGFEQTKRCYLTEVIPFFNLLKEHFDGVQKSLVTEVRAMKAVFENLEAEVDQNEIDLKSSKIEQKNLLIANENLIAECLSKDVFYTATDSMLNVSRFFDTHDAFTTAQKQIENLKAQLKENSKCVTISDGKPKVLATGRYPIDVELIPPRLKNNREVHLDYIKHVKESVETLREIEEEAKELLEHVIGTCPKDFNPHDKQNASTTLLRKKRVTFIEPCETSTHNPPAQVEHQKINLPNAHGIPSTGVKGASAASGSKPRSNIKKDRTLPAKSALKQVEAHSRMNKSNEKQKNRVDSSISYKRTVVQIILWYLDSGCSKHMTGDRSRLRNFMKKFIGTVRFGNDHFGAIMGYGDYVIGASVISRVYYVEGLRHNLFSVGQFCDSDIEVAFRKHTCFVRDLDGVDLIKGNHGTNLYTIFVKDMMRSSPIYLLSKASKNKSWLWHRHLNHLNFGTLNDLARKDLVRGLPWLKFDKDHLCSACQLGKSKKSTHKPKTINTIMEVLHTLHMDLCGPLRVQSINGKKYILVIVDDFSRFTWVKFLRSKDETPAFVINLLKQLQVGLNKTVRFVRTDNGTEFVNKDLTDYYESVGITHEKTVLRTPQ